MSHETIFTMETSSIKVGAGATREIGHDIQQFDVQRVMVVTDPNLAKLEPVQVVMDALKTVGIDAVLYDGTKIEPTDASFKEAIAFAVDGNFDGFVAVGGGSVIDTAKAANLYATYPADFLAYVNAPVGEGRPVPGALKPLIAIPTTAGTGSETTGVAIFDFLEMEVKTGISGKALRPVLGIIDPDNTKTLPPAVAASAGLDVLCHAIESMTTIPYNQRTAPQTPAQRPPYQGANPISDIWTAKSIELTNQYLVRAMTDPEDEEARMQMLMASCFAGIGFGNSGVHLPHAMAYPVAGMVRDFYPEGYNSDHPMVPHGMSVILNAPAVFRFTATVNPQAHLQAAALMGVDTTDADESDAGEHLANALIDIMHKTGVPNGLRAIGYTEDDAEKLADGALPQRRLTKLSPRPVEKSDLVQLFKDAMQYW